MILRKVNDFRYYREIRAGVSGKQIKPVDLRDVLDDVAPIPVQHRKLMGLHAFAILKYYPQPYAGHVTVFRAPRQPLFCSHDPLMGWQTHAAQVSVRQVAGSHHNLLQEPYVHTLARELQAALEEAQGIETQHNNR